jgi:hypothetical protein
VVERNGEGEFDPVAVVGSTQGFCELLLKKKETLCQKNEDCTTALLGKSYTYSLKVDIQASQIEAYGDCTEGIAEDDPLTECQKMAQQKVFTLFSRNQATETCKKAIAAYAEKKTNLCAFMTSNLFQPYFWWVRELKDKDTTSAF